MKKLVDKLKKWQGLGALLVAVAIFLFSPVLLRLYDHTTGVFDAGYLQRPILGAVFAFATNFIAWAALQLDFPTVNKWIDSNRFKHCWDGLTPREQVHYLAIILGGEVLIFLICMALVPVA